MSAPNKTPDRNTVLQAALEVVASQNSCKSQAVKSSTVVVDPQALKVAVSNQLDVEIKLPNIDFLQNTTWQDIINANP